MFSHHPLIGTLLVRQVGDLRLTVRLTVRLTAIGSLPLPKHEGTDAR